MKIPFAGPPRRSGPPSPRPGPTFEDLLEGAAGLLGAQPADARQIREEGVLVAEGMVVVLTVLPLIEGTPPGVMICVDSGLPIAQGPGAASLLANAPALLHLQGVAIGSSGEGTWSLYGLARDAELDAPSLANRIATVRRMADILRSPSAQARAGDVHAGI